MVQSLARPNAQAQVALQDDFIREIPSHSAADECDAVHVSQERSPPPTIHTNQEEGLGEQRAAFELAQLPIPLKRAAVKRHSSPPYSETSFEQTSTEHGIKSAFAPAESQAKRSRLGGHILDDSRFSSTNAQSLLEYHLFNPENPINKDLITYAVRLPRESSFSLETLEPATTPRRRPHSPNSRARIARVRKNGGACADCKKKKKAVSFVLSKTI